MVCQGELTHQITEVTKEVSNSFNQERFERLLSNFSPEDPTISLSTLIYRPGSPVLMYSHSEGSLNEKHAHQGAGMGVTEGVRCTYNFFTVACADY